MADTLTLTRLLDDVPVEIYERSAMIPNPALGMMPMKTVYETFYVLPAPNWPKVRIRTRYIFARLLYRLGYQPGLKLDDERFNAAYRVDSEDDDFAALLLSPELQAFLLEKTSVSWSAGRGAIKLFYRGGLRKKRIDKSLQRLRNFRDLIDAELFTFSDSIS
ncbi:MAG: hypothetical protein IH984_13600 [Planctomycetes bacterium]|nr:hypothetical protein [Planctomycetota bacterium]